MERPLKVAKRLTKTSFRQTQNFSITKNHCFHHHSMRRSQQTLKTSNLQTGKRNENFLTRLVSSLPQKTAKVVESGSNSSSSLVLRVAGVSGAAAVLMGAYGAHGGNL